MGKQKFSQVWHTTLPHMVNTLLNILQNQKVGDLVTWYVGPTKDNSLLNVKIKFSSKCNENVDKKTKDFINLHPTNFPLPYSIFLSILWNNSVVKNFFEIKLDSPNQYYEMSDKKLYLLVCVLVTQGSHTQNLLKREEQPHCVGCDAPFAVRRILLECGEFSHIRNKMLIPSNNCLKI